MTTARARTAALELQVEMKDAEVAQYEQSIARLKGEVDRLLESQTALESEVEVLRLTNAGAALDALRYRVDVCEAQLASAGQRADDLEAQQRQARLNQAQASSGGSQSSRRAAPSRDEPQDRYVFARQPYVTVVGDGSVVVEGTVHNTNDQEIEGFVQVILTVNGQEVDSVSLPMAIGAGTVDGWDTTFRVTRLDGTVSARAEWDKER